nr:Wzz/FepE/Etk N-terminal domain-containing protein [uncultured Mucilaginibacter sp.]
MQDKTVPNNDNDDELTVKDLIRQVGSTIKYVKSKWLLILTFAILCSLLGLAYAFIKKPSYTAVSTFVLEEGNKGGALSQYSGLASLAGIDIGGGGGGGGIFQGDNILELYKSRVMIEKTLLSPVVINSKKQLLIYRYIDFNKLRDKWHDNPALASVTFDGDPAHFSRLQDSIVSGLVETFNNKLLSVTKLDKKLSIIRVDVTATDELFAREFNTKLVETVNDFYTQTKTKKSAQNIQVLQRQADSVKRVLGYSISSVAYAVDAAPNANPAMSTLKVPSQKKQVDVQASGAIYGEIVKNLELSKISLRQETPLIQVIDQPVLPLPMSKLGKVKGAVIGFAVGMFVCIAWLLFKKIAASIMA